MNDASNTPRPPAFESTSHRSANAVAWLIGGRLVARLADLCSLLVLVRVLTPTDFGKVAIAMTLVVIVEALLELPLGQALVRAPVIEQSHYDTAFTLGLLRGLAVAGLVLGIAWPYAVFNHDASLTPLICALGLAPALRGIGSPRFVNFARRLDFRPDFVIEIISKVAALIVACTVAYLTQSYWALAAGTITSPLVAATVSYILAPYRPRLSLSEWRSFDNLVMWNTVGQIISVISWQCDRLLLGRFATREQLGEYAVANDLSGLPFQSLFAPFWRSLVASFATVQDFPDRLRTAYAKSINAVFLIGAPILAGIATMAVPFERILLGEQWQNASTMLAFFSVGYLIALYGLPAGALAIALNRSQLNAMVFLTVLLVKLPLVIVGYYYYGVPGVVAGFIAGSIATAIATGFSSRKMTGIKLREHFAAPWRPLVAAAAMAAVVAPLTLPIAKLPVALPLLLAVAAIIGVGGIVYISLVFVLWHFAGRPNGSETIVYERVTHLADGILRRGRSPDT